MAEIRGTIDGRGARIGVVVARFNEFVTRRLLDGARERLGAAGVAPDDQIVVFVPGAFEIPLAAQILIERERVDGVVCLGAVIRGGTPHFEYVCRAATDGCRDVMLRTGVPVGFGILTTENLEQALERSGDGEGHKGEEAAETVLEMVAVVRALGGRAG